MTIHTLNTQSPASFTYSFTISIAVWFLFKILLELVVSLSVSAFKPQARSVYHDDSVCGVIVRNPLNVVGDYRVGERPWF